VNAARNRTQEPADSESSWPVSKRALASALILAFLFVVFMGPVTNPISTEELTAPIARTLAPVHQSLFLGHGYRFFAPDPGPSHLLLVRTSPEGENKLVFPDRNRHWPRLMYHRWFMLSESVWSEYQSMPDRASFDAMQKDLETRGAQFREAGKISLSRSMRAMRDRREVEWTRGMERIKVLTNSIVREMTERTGKPAQLFLQERAIPMQANVVVGERLDDPKFLSPPAPISGAEVIGQ